MPLEFSFDRIAYTGCIRCLSALSPYQIVLARGSQVEYFCYKETIKQWILHSSCFFGFIQPNGCFNVPSSPSTVNDKAEYVCGLSGALLASSKDSTCSTLKTSPTNSKDEESTNHFPFVLFAFGLHFFQMFQFASFAKSETAQHSFKKDTKPVVLTSGQVHLTESRVLDVKIIFKEIKSTHITETSTRIGNEKDFLMFHGSVVAVCSAYNSIDIHSLYFEQDTLHLILTPSLKKIKGPLNTLLLSFALSTFILPENTSEILFRCAAGSMDGKILLWTQKLQVNYTYSVLEGYPSLTKPKPLKIQLTVADALNHDVKYESGGILKLKFFFQGQLLVSLSENRTIHLWKSKPDASGYYSYASTMPYHRARIWDIAAFRNADNCFYFISVGEDNQWILWNLYGIPCYQMKAHVGRGITCVSFPIMLDNSMPPFFVTAGVDGDVKLWSLQFFKNIWSSSQFSGLLDQQENLQPNSDHVKLFMSPNLENSLDYVRDIVITENESYIITNLGAVLRFLHLSPYNIAFNLDSSALEKMNGKCFTTENGRKVYLESLVTFPFHLTCISLSHVEQQKNDTDSTNLFLGSMKPWATLLVMGTVCGKCCLSLMCCSHCLFDGDVPFQTRNALPLEMPSAQFEFSPHHWLLSKQSRWKATFSVFENFRVQRTFAEPLVSHPLWNMTIGAVQVIAVTSHDGLIHIYWVDVFRALSYCSNEKIFYTLMSSEERENTGIHHIFSAQIAPPKPTHANRIFSFAVLPFVCDETSKKTTDSIKLLHLSLFFGDEHGKLSFVTISISLRLMELFHHPFNRLNYYTFSNVENSCELKLISLTKRNFCKIHCLRVYPYISSTTNTIHATANDGTIYMCSFRLNVQQPKTTYCHTDSQLEIQKIIKLKQFRIIYDMLNFNQEKQQFNYIACFHGSDFVLWCTESDTEVWRFPCGGSRRPFRIHYTEESLTEYTLKSFLCASIKDSCVMLHWKSWREPKDCTKEGAICLVNQPCVSLLGSSHGREIWCAIWLTSSYLCTAGETGSLYEYALETPFGFKEKQLKSVAGHHHSTTALRCVALITYESYSFLIFGCAKQFLLLYVYDHHEEKYQGFLLKKWQLSLQHDERISCVSCFFQHLTPLDASSSHPQPCLCLHIIAGTSSGKILHEPVYLEKACGEFKVTSFSKTRSSNDIVSHLQQNHSILASLPCGILCSEFHTVGSQVTSDSTYALYHCGCVNGSIYTYLASYLKDVTKLTWCYLLEIQAHQAGTTCLAVSPLHTLISPFSQNDNTNSHFISEQMSTCAFYLASGGDDNSVTLQHLQLTLVSAHPLCQKLHITRVPRSHISSVRGLCWSGHVLVSVGWDKMLRFWKPILTTSSSSTECATMNYSQKKLLVDLPIFQHTPSSLSLQLLHSISTQVGDTAGLAVVSRDVSKTASMKSCVALRLAVFGAHGIEVVDITLKD